MAAALAAWFALQGMPAGAVGLNLGKIQAAFARLGGKPNHLQDWQKLIEDTKPMSNADKLKRVNDFFNRRITFGDDSEVWGQSDYWATPLETMAKNNGDCEDFVIAKYYTLLNSNVPVEMLRLIYVKARLGGPSSNVQQAHMVLAFYASPDAEPLILDNLINDIRPAARRTDLQPIFSFNGQGVFAGVAANSAVGPGGVGRLTRWQELLKRAGDEGFE